MKPQALYRFFGAGGELLYIGISSSPGHRFGQHRDSKPWWTEVVGITLEHFPDRTSVENAERDAIRRERPRYNVVHNGEARPAVQSRPGPDRGWPAELMPDVCHACERADPGGTPAYFPFSWALGVALYTCINGHAWACKWGQDGSGTADLEPVWPHQSFPTTQTWIGHPPAELSPRRWSAT